MWNFYRVPLRRGVSLSIITMFQLFKTHPRFRIELICQRVTISIFLERIPRVILVCRLRTFPWLRVPHVTCFEAWRAAEATKRRTRPGHVTLALPWERCEPKQKDVAGNPRMGVV